MQNIRQSSINQRGFQPSIVTSEDDPIVGVDDFKALANVSPYLSLRIQRYGGHIGYIDLFPFRRWLAEAIPAILS